MKQSGVNAEVVRRYAVKLGLVKDEGKKEGDGEGRKGEIEAAAVAFGESIGEWPAFPDTVAAMKRLGERFKLVPLSNIDRASFERSLRGPLRGCRFDAVYTAEDIGVFLLFFPSSLIWCLLLLVGLVWREKVVCREKNRNARLRLCLVDYLSEQVATSPTLATSSTCSSTSKRTLAWERISCVMLRRVSSMITRRPRSLG